MAGSSGSAAIIGGAASEAMNQGGRGYEAVDALTARAHAGQGLSHYRIHSHLICRDGGIYSSRWHGLRSLSHVLISTRQVLLKVESYFTNLNLVAVLT